MINAIIRGLTLSTLGVFIAYYLYDSYVVFSFAFFVGALTTLPLSILAHVSKINMEIEQWIELVLECQRPEPMKLKDVQKAVKRLFEKEMSLIKLKLMLSKLEQQHKIKTRYSRDECGSLMEYYVT